MICIEYSGPDEIRTRDHLIKSFTMIPYRCSFLLASLDSSAGTRLSYRPISISALVGTFIKLLSVNHRSAALLMPHCMLFVNVFAKGCFEPESKPRQGFMIAGLHYQGVKRLKGIAIPLQQN